MHEMRVRPSRPSDYDFLWWLHQATMKEYVDKTWGWDGDVQARAFQHAFETDHEGLQIIEYTGERIGYIRVVAEPSRLFLAAIELAPSHQRRGIGTALIEDVCGRADSMELPVELHVLKVNPAKHLYERLGFVTQGETETHYLMRRGKNGAV